MNYTLLLADDCNRLELRCADPSSDELVDLCVRAFTLVKMPQRNARSSTGHSGATHSKRLC